MSFYLLYPLTISHNLYIIKFDKHLLFLLFASILLFFYFNKYLMNAYYVHTDFLRGWKWSSSFLSFLPSFFFCPSLPFFYFFLPSLLASFLIGSSLCMSRRGQKMWVWFLYCLPTNKATFIVYYLTLSIRHNGLDTSCSQTLFLTFSVPHCHL